MPRQRDDFDDAIHTREILERRLVWHADSLAFTVERFLLDSGWRELVAENLNKFQNCRQILEAQDDTVHAMLGFPCQLATASAAWEDDGGTIR